MVWVKSTENYLNSKSDILFKICEEKTGIFEKPYVFACLHEHDAQLVAPGLIEIHNDVGKCSEKCHSPVYDITHDNVEIASCSGQSQIVDSDDIEIIVESEQLYIPNTR